MDHNKFAEDDRDSTSSFEKINLHDSDNPIENQIDDAPAQEPHRSSTVQQPNSDTPLDPRSHIDPVVKELEEAAAVVAAASKEAAHIAQQKLMKGAAEAKAFVSSLWSVFDDSTPKSTPQQTDEEFKKRLGLDADEPILETFRCKMLQKYNPTNNSFTPQKIISFSGQLHIAGSHVCFELDGSVSGKPISLKKEEIVSFDVVDKSAIEITLVEGRSLIVGQFSFQMELDSAALLLEKFV